VERMQAPLSQTAPKDIDTRRKSDTRATEGGPSAAAPRSHSSDRQQEAYAPESLA